LATSFEATFKITSRGDDDACRTITYLYIGACSSLLVSFFTIFGKERIGFSNNTFGGAYS